MITVSLVTRPHPPFASPSELGSAPNDGEGEAQEERRRRVLRRSRRCRRSRRGNRGAGAALGAHRLRGRSGLPRRDELRSPDTRANQQDCSGHGRCDVGACADLAARGTLRGGGHPRRRERARVAPTRRGPVRGRGRRARADHGAGARPRGLYGERSPPSPKQPRPRRPPPRHRRRARPRRHLHGRQLLRATPTPSLSAKSRRGRTAGVGRSAPARGSPKESHPSRSSPSPRSSKRGGARTERSPRRFASDSSAPTAARSRSQGRGRTSPGRQGASTSVPSPGHRGVSSSRRACARRGVCSRRRAPRSPPFGPTHAPGSRSASSRAHVSSSSGRSSPRSRGGPSPLSSVTDSSSSPTRPSSKPLQSPLPERPASVLPFGDQRVSERTFPLRV